MVSTNRTPYNPDVHVFVNDEEITEGITNYTHNMDSANFHGSCFESLRMDNMLYEELKDYNPSGNVEYTRLSTYTMSINDTNLTNNLLENRHEFDLRVEVRSSDITNNYKAKISKRPYGEMKPYGYVCVLTFDCSEHRTGTAENYKQALMNRMIANTNK